MSWHYNKSKKTKKSKKSKGNNKMKSKSKTNSRKSTRTRTRSRSRSRSRSASRNQKGGVLYSFDNTDMIGGLPAVKAVSNCPPGVEATDADWGMKLYDKFGGQKGGMNRDGIRADIIQNLQEGSSKSKNNKK
jgi:hypothetical protein